MPIGSPGPGAVLRIALVEDFRPFRLVDLIVDAHRPFHVGVAELGAAPVGHAAAPDLRREEGHGEPGLARLQQFLVGVRPARCLSQPVREHVIQRAPLPVSLVHKVKSRRQFLRRISYVGYPSVLYHTHPHAIVYFIELDQFHARSPPLTVGFPLARETRTGNDYTRDIIYPRKALSW